MANFALMFLVTNSLVVARVLPVDRHYKGYCGRIDGFFLLVWLGREQTVQWNCLIIPRPFAEIILLERLSTDHDVVVACI